MGKRRIRRGELITVPYGAGNHSALVTDVRDGRVYVRVDPATEHAIETFYRFDELGVA